MRLAAVLALLLAVPAGAAPILDLDVAPLSGGVLNVDNDANGVQTFSVGTSGTIVRIDVYAVNDFETCTIFCGLLLGATSSPLAFVASSPQGGGVLEDWIAFALTTPLPVLAGDVLSFDVEHDNFIVWATGSYMPGVAWTCLTDPCSHPLNPDPFDHSTDVPEGTSFALTESYAFRVWILPAQVPEPTALAFGAAAFAAAAAARLGSRAAARRGRRPQPAR